MSNEILHRGLLRSNVPLLANAIELGANAINDVAGNAISNVVDGELLNPTFLHSALAARMQSLLVNFAVTGG